MMMNIELVRLRGSGSTTLVFKSWNQLGWLVQDIGYPGGWNHGGCAWVISPRFIKHPHHCCPPWIVGSSCDLSNMMDELLPTIVYRMTWYLFIHTHACPHIISSTYTCAYTLHITLHTHTTHNTEHPPAYLIAVNHDEPLWADNQY